MLPVYVALLLVYSLFFLCTVCCWKDECKNVSSLQIFHPLAIWVKLEYKLVKFFKEKCTRLQDMQINHLCVFLLIALVALELALIISYFCTISLAVKMASANPKGCKQIQSLITLVPTEEPIWAGPLCLCWRTPSFNIDSDSWFLARKLLLILLSYFNRYKLYNCCTSKYIYVFGKYYFI